MVLEEVWPIDRGAGRLVPGCEVFGDQVVDGGGVGEKPLFELDAMQPVELGVLLQDRCDDSFEFSLFTEGFTSTRSLADLSTEVRAEPSM